jgi:hypothetical protein
MKIWTAYSGEFSPDNSAHGSPFATCVIAGEHGQRRVGTPKMPGEPKRVQPSRDRDLKRENRAE